MMGKNASCFLRTAFVKTPVFPAIVMVSAVFGCLFQHEQASAEGCPDPSFAAARTFNAGTNPVSVATGDFNGDGKPDLAAANNQGVAVLLDNRDGTFQRAVNYTAGAGPRFVTVGDFNGDGEADLAVANYGEYDQAHYRYTNSSVSVLIGKGDGTFQAAVNYRAGSTPFSLAVGDLNGDGKADLVVANDSANLGAAGSGAGSVLLGNGDGSFQAPFNYGAGTFPVAVAIADFNGDGKLDLAVADGTFGSAYFSLLPGKGNGTFLHPTNYYGARGARSVAAGDFNSDGKPDLAVANDGATNISVFLGKGDGTFQLAVNYATGNGPVSLAVSDFNADGKLDLVSANTGGISVLLGKGDGTFQSALNYFGGGVHYQMPVSLAVGDFNGDGQRDLASANEEGVTVFLGNGAGTFQFAANYDSGMYPVSMAVADFNGDGKPDMAVAQAAYENLTDGSIAVLVGKDNATFETLKTYGAGTRPVSVAVGDFNGDGKLDLAAANTGSYPYYTNGSVSVLLGDGNGTFQTATNFKVGTCPSCVAMGDFNSDGKLDLAVANQGTTRDTTSIGSVSILVGNGDGTFQAAVNYDAGRYPSYAAVGDFNGDGRPDLVVASGNSMIEVGRVFVLLG
ncbi:MAG: hypothetical protein DME18_14190, partial [Verrucomicrobia bacterium]